MNHCGKRMAVGLFASTLASMSTLGTAQSDRSASHSQHDNASTAADAANGSDAKQQIIEAAKLVRQMDTDPQLRKLLQQAKGVFVVPSYGRAGWSIGARGGEGVLLGHNGGTWSDPVFYNIGGISAGAQAGWEGGSIAMILMNRKAVDEFMKKNNFSLTTGAGLTIVNYTGKAGGAVGIGDVITWSDTKGAFANATIGATDIRFDEEDSQNFYKTKVSPKDILAGNVKSGEAAALKQALAGEGTGQAQSYGGSATGGTTHVSRTGK